MLLTLETKTAATDLLEGKAQPKTDPIIPIATGRRILNSAVRLFGSAKSGEEGFDGSGVIFNLDAGAAYILTAAHNVEMWAGLDGPPNDWGVYLSDFAKAMKVGYGNGTKDMAFNVAPIGTSDSKKNSIDKPPLPGPCSEPTADQCTYDVLMLKSTDVKLRAYAQKYVFANQGFPAIKTLVQQECETVRDSTAALLNTQLYYYVQLGFGKIQDDRSPESLDKTGRVVKGPKVLKNCGPGFSINPNRLQYRLPVLDARAVVSMYGQNAQPGNLPTYLEYASAIALDGPMSSSTCSGDSGGPLWAIDKATKTQTYLLGVTTGGDMLTDQSITDNIFFNNVSTSVAPYFGSIFPPQ